MAMKSYFMDELHSIRAEIVNCKNKTKDPTSVDVKISELQSKIGILEPFKRQYHRMVKHTQTIRWRIADELFECV